MTETAAKNDTGKATRPELLDANWLLGVGEVLKFGAEKYSDNNWRRGGLAWSRVYGAALRHLLAFWQLNEVDEETGLSHLLHASCCLMFLYAYTGGGYESDDDRP